MIAFLTLAVLGGGVWTVAALLAITAVLLALVEVVTEHRSPRRILLVVLAVSALAAAFVHLAFLVPAMTVAALLGALPAPSRTAALPHRGSPGSLSTEHVFATLGVSPSPSTTRVEGSVSDDDPILPANRDRILTSPLESRL